MTKQSEHTKDLPETELPSVSLQKRIRMLKRKLVSLLLLCAILLATLAVALRFGIAWFTSNTVVSAQPAAISAEYQEDYLLASLGRPEKASGGFYDEDFGITISTRTERIGGEDYTIASTDSSLFVNFQKHLNNLFKNADLRPGNRGSFDLYLICRSADKRSPVLYPVFSAWHEDPQTLQKNDAFAEPSTSSIRIAAEYLKGHILLFASMDSQGRFSGYIDNTQPISLNLDDPTKKTATQGDRTFQWGERVYEDSETGQAVYRLPVYWVWPEQFGNFLYPKTLYDKNLFAEGSDDQDLLIQSMNQESDRALRKFFHVDPPRESLDLIDSNALAGVFNQYSDWYNMADDMIGEHIAYIQLGFEIRS